ncbi:MAG TPA: MerR family transcriptional regulator [Ktedonobacteraceae bacterium]|nr:MerR family transcriptional regulator [Ktedonobacteraceae bacterium]
MRRLKIGEVAKLTGLSIRTLRYYEEIKLISAAQRSESGQRLYSQDDLQRLQQIVALRQLGCSLDEIVAVLFDQSPLCVMETQLQRLKEEMSLRQRLIGRLESVIISLRERQDITTDDLIELIKGTVMLEKYYSAEQRDYLKQRAEKLGVSAIQDAERQWSELIAGVRAHMQRGSRPDSAEVQELALKWLALIEQFTGGDEGVSQSLKNMYQSEGPDKASRGALDKDVCEYINAAVASLR